jgi:hypothetical protein
VHDQVGDERMRVVNRSKTFPFVRFVLGINGIIGMMALLTACSGSERSRLIENLIPGPDSQTSAPIISSVPLETKLVTHFTDEYGVPMALVPAGSFEMGSFDGDED